MPAVHQAAVRRFRVVQAAAEPMRETKRRTGTRAPNASKLRRGGPGAQLQRCTVAYAIRNSAAMAGPLSPAAPSLGCPGSAIVLPCTREKYQRKGNSYIPEQQPVTENRKPRGRMTAPLQKDKAQIPEVEEKEGTYEPQKQEHEC